jgi:hypothetical protein
MNKISQSKRDTIIAYKHNETNYALHYDVRCNAAFFLFSSNCTVKKRQFLLPFAEQKKLRHITIPHALTQKHTHIQTHEY